MRQDDNRYDENYAGFQSELEYCKKRIVSLEEAEKRMGTIEEALRETESHLDMAQQMAHVGSWVYYVKTDVSKWSDEMYRIFGLPPHTPINFNKFLSYIHPDDREKIRNEVEQGRHEKKPVSFDYRIIRPDGAERILHSERRSVFVDSQPDRVFGADQDITERRRIETALQETKALAEMYIDLMSHDINNMNQIALGYLELALDMISRGEKVGKENELMIAKPLEMLKNSSALIDNVKKVKRERMGVYGPKVMDLGEILAEVKAMYTSKIDSDITISYESSACKVKANELLKDVFINLVGNAIKHSGRPLTISLHITSKSIKGKKYCLASVEDNGPGMPDETKKAIFDHLSNKGTWKGRSGFGLYLVKTLVDDYHGRFWVEDRVPGDPAKGCRFIVELPAAE